VSLKSPVLQESAEPLVSQEWQYALQRRCRSFTSPWRRVPNVSLPQHVLEVLKADTE